MNPFQAKTVASAIAPLLKVLKNLEAVVEASSTKISANHDAISRLQAENGSADIERTQADRIIKALSGIVNPKE